MYSTTEENYLKAIYKLSDEKQSPVSTNGIAGVLETSAASVTDMLKRLTEKGLLHYEKYRGVTLTKEGLNIAVQLVRRHRLWEVFLMDKLGYSWDEVHDLAEQLEHVQGEQLTERLDSFLGYPKYDPHGDPIPDADGNLEHRMQIPLSSLEKNTEGILTGVEENSSSFLKHLDRIGLALGVRIRVIEKFDFDGSIQIQINNETPINISEKIAQNVFVKA